MLRSGHLSKILAFAATFTLFQFVLAVRADIDPGLRELGSANSVAVEKRRQHTTDGLRASRYTSLQQVPRPCAKWLSRLAEFELSIAIQLGEGG
jgi:hypothetical protein